MSNNIIHYNFPPAPVFGLMARIRDAEALHQPVRWYLTECEEGHEHWGQAVPIDVWLACPDQYVTICKTCTGEPECFNVDAHLVAHPCPTVRVLRGES